MLSLLSLVFALAVSASNNYYAWNGNEYIRCSGQECSNIPRSPLWREPPMDRFIPETDTSKVMQLLINGYLGQGARDFFLSSSQRGYDGSMVGRGMNPASMNLMSSDPHILPTIVNSLLNALTQRNSMQPQTYNQYGSPYGQMTPPQMYNPYNQYGGAPYGGQMTPPPMYNQYGGAPYGGQMMPPQTYNPYSQYGSPYFNPMTSPQMYNPYSSYGQMVPPNPFSLYGNPMMSPNPFTTPLAPYSPYTSPLYNPASLYTNPLLSPMNSPILNSLNNPFMNLYNPLLNSLNNPFMNLYNPLLNHSLTNSLNQFGPTIPPVSPIHHIPLSEPIYSPLTGGLGSAISPPLTAASIPLVTPQMNPALNPTMLNPLSLSLLNNPAVASYGSLSMARTYPPYYY